MTKIKRIETIPADYANNNGFIIIDVTGGKKPYKYSIDGGVTFSNTKEFLVYGGKYEVVVKDSEGVCTEMQNVTVRKVLSTIQAEYLNNLFDTFGNESQAASQTPTKYDVKGKPIEYGLSHRTAHAWRKDPDFAVFVREMKLDSNEYFKDFLEAKAIAIINGGIPIYQYISAPNPPTDEEGNITDYTKRIKIQVGETLPDASMVRFMLERRFKDTYSIRSEITGKDGSGRIIAITLADEFAMEEVENE